MTAPIRIMPCLDMQNGRVVKGVHFVDIKDAGDPVECARAYCAAGIHSRIHRGQSPIPSPSIV